MDPVRIQQATLAHNEKKHRLSSPAHTHTLSLTHLSVRSSVTVPNIHRHPSITRVPSACQCRRHFSAAATPTPTPTPTRTTESTKSTSTTTHPAQPKEDAKQQSKVEEEDEEPPPPPKKGGMQPITWTSLVFLCVAGSGALVYGFYQRDKKKNTVKIESIGTPLLGGPWSLTDDSGKRVTSADLHGAYPLIYFGFTWCPDVCPKELERMAEVMELLEKFKVKQRVVPIFISLDPKRDTPARLSQYKKKWSDKIMWLTGTDEEIKSVTRAFRVYYSPSETTAGSDDDYLIDHSVFFFLMDGEGKLMEYFGGKSSPQEIAFKIQQGILAENK